MARKDEARTRMIVGMFVVILSVTAFVSLFLIGQTEGTWKPKTEISTDFRTITGLRRGSPVQLAGVEIDPAQAELFDSRQGQALGGVVEEADGRLRFYNLREGIRPSDGRKIRPCTPEDVARWQRGKSLQ